MKKTCEHKYWEPKPNFLQCVKCEHTMKVFPFKSYSQEEFRKLYPPLNVDEGKVIFEKPIGT